MVCLLLQSIVRGLSYSHGRLPVTTTLEDDFPWEGCQSIKYFPVLGAVDSEPQGSAPALEPVDQRGEMGVQASDALHTHARVPVAGGPHRFCDPG